MKRNYLILFSGIIILSVISCNPTKHSCSAYVQKLNQKLKKADVYKIIDYLSPYIDYSESFTISAFGQAETIHNKEELSSFLPQLTEDIPLNTLQTMLQSVNDIQSIVHINKDNVTILKLHILRSENKISLMHIDFFYETHINQPQNNLSLIQR